MNRAVLGFFLLSSALALAAEGDFLTEAEIDHVRLAQEPNARLQLYLDFARQRLDQVKQMAKDTRPGRAAMMHDLLDEYSQIIDAIDTVSDDALEHRTDIGAGTKAVASAEKTFLSALEKLHDSSPPDLSRYEFLLTQAIETTRDSLEAASEDPAKRAAAVAERQKKEKKVREASMTSEEAAAKKAEADATPKPKKPTLLKPGETLDQQHK